MKKLILLFTIVFSLQATATCLPKYEKAFAKTLLGQQKTTRVGKVVTGTAFVTVGGFYGVMGVILLGPLWAGAITGAVFGTAAALPVGATFVIIHQGQKIRLKKLGRMMSVLQRGEEFNILLNDLQKEIPEFTADELDIQLSQMDFNESICNGAISRIGKFASVKDIKKAIISGQSTHELY